MNQKLLKRKQLIKQGGSLFGKDFGAVLEKVCFAQFIMPQNQTECKYLTLFCAVIPI